MVTLGRQGVSLAGDPLIVGGSGGDVVHLALKFWDVAFLDLGKMSDALLHLRGHLFRGGVFRKRAEKPTKADNICHIFCPRMDEESGGVLM